MASDRSSLTTAEVDTILTTTVSSRLYRGKNNVTALGRINTPTLNMMRGQSKGRTTPVRGGYKAQVKGPGGRKLQTWSGRDLLTFQGVDTIMDLEYFVGRVHLGDEWVHQQLEEAGVDVDYTKTAKGGAVPQVTSDAWEVLTNLAEEKLDDGENDYVQELNKMLWRASASDAKAFPGIDGLLPVTSNATGTIGGKSRSNPLLRHQLMTSVDVDDLELKLNQLVRACNKRTRDGSKLNFAVCGENLYDAIIEKMFSGSNATSSPVFDRQRMEEKARTIGDKLSIGFPDDAIYVVGIGLLMIEPTFEDLDKEDAPATAWSKRLYALNLSHIAFKPTKNKDGAVIVHPTPHNQRITNISYHGEYALCADKLDCHGVLAIS